MQHASAVDLLTRHQLRRDGDVFHVEPKTVVSVYIANGTSTLILDKVASIAIYAEVAMIETSRHERYGIELVDLRAIRLTPEAIGPGYK